MTLFKNKIFLGAVYIVALVAVLLYAWDTVKPQESPGETEQTEPQWPGYGTGQYEYYYSEDDPSRVWEEDTLYLIDTLLTEHPVFCDERFVVYTGYVTEGAGETEYSNRLFDAGKQAKLIAAANDLIPRLSTLKEEQIVMELQRLMAIAGDSYTKFYVDLDQRFPLMLQPIYDGNAVSFYVVTVPAGQEELLYSRLTAINGIPIAEVASRLTYYISGSNVHYKIYMMSSPLTACWLLQTLPLVGIGAMEPGETSAELTFETDGSTVIRTFEAATKAERAEMDLVKKTKTNMDWLSYRDMPDDNLWLECLEEENAVYMRIIALMDNESLRFSTFLPMGAKAVETAGEGCKLIIDLRDCFNGYAFESQIYTFANRINQASPAGVYILVDGGTGAAGLAAAYRLKCNISGAQIVGAPTGEGLVSLGDLVDYKLPNSGLSFCIRTSGFCLAEGTGEDMLTPDILVHQTLEDMKNGTDTMLQYVLDLEP